MTVQNFEKKKPYAFKTCVHRNVIPQQIETWNKNIKQLCDHDILIITATNITKLCNNTMMKWVLLSHNCSIMN